MCARRGLVVAAESIGRFNGRYSKMSDDLATFRVISEILGPAGVTPGDVVRWHRMPNVQSSFRSLKFQGTRYYSRDSVLELTFISAFAKVGIRPGIGILHAHDHMELSNLPRLPEWTMFRTGFRNTLIYADDLNSKVVTEFLTANPGAAVIIAFRSIVQRIDKLFSNELTDPVEIVIP